ncbi:hypothetical protein FACS1894184_03660 [Clostridia bacterium]|nr:hypothetical protein FACS1894184_03660 [Clostridia bacterium]
MQLENKKDISMIPNEIIPARDNDIITSKEPIARTIRVFMALFATIEVATI